MCVYAFNGSVLAGHLVVLKDEGHGPQEVMEYRERGVFGELALLYDMPRAATVRSRSECKLWVLQRGVFRDTLMRETMRKREYWQECLASIPLLSNLDRYERLVVADALETVTFEEDTAIVREGEPGDKFYIILDGSVRVTKGGVEVRAQPMTQLLLKLTVCVCLFCRRTIRLSPRASTSVSWRCWTRLKCAMQPSRALALRSWLLWSATRSHCSWVLARRSWSANVQSTLVSRLYNELLAAAHRVEMKWKKNYNKDEYT